MLVRYVYSSVKLHLVVDGGRLTSCCDSLGVFPGGVGPPLRPGGTGPTVTLGMMMAGGKGLKSGGQISILKRMKSRVKQRGLGRGSGCTVLVGCDPGGLVTTIVEIRMSWVVKGGGSVDVVMPSAVMVNGGGSQVVVVVMGGKTRVHGKLHET